MAPRRRRLMSIPACAGEVYPRVCGGTEIHSPANCWRWVYPRVCGGTLRCQRCGDDIPGLSPRVRGNRFRGPGVILFCGSIPACAGEPRRRTPYRRQMPVYPRVCGGT